MATNKNITQTQMGDFLGVSQQYINLLIKNKMTPKIDKIKRFSKITGTDILFWFDASGPEKEAAIKQAMESKSNAVASSINKEAS